jgi:hypothetical protein
MCTSGEALAGLEIILARIRRGDRGTAHVPRRQGGLRAEGMPLPLDVQREALPRQNYYGVVPRGTRHAELSAVDPPLKLSAKSPSRFLI